MTTQQQVKEVLDIIEITTEQIREENRAYNPKEWDKIVDRYLSYGNPKFYKAIPQRGYSYPRYYVTYTINGINVMNSISYSSCLSNSGMCLVEIRNNKVYTKLLRDGNGNYGYCEKTKENRVIMAKHSKNFGVIYSDEF